VFVLDTCALLWWALDPQKLSLLAKQACGQIERAGGFVSSISVWEIGIKIKKGNLELGIPLHNFVSRLKKTNIEIVAIDESIWLENLGLPWKHPDPADRTIVATAKLRQLPIVTPDTHIRSFYSDTIW
jgi:PIN domain nuclease of toxin-antitoxin system